MSSGIGSAAYFRPLISVLQKIQAEGHQDFSDQLAAFERETLSYELDPSCFNWVELNYALGAAVAFSEALECRGWTPGREDLTPLFNIEGGVS